MRRPFFNILIAIFIACGFVGDGYACGTSPTSANALEALKPQLPWVLSLHILEGFNEKDPRIPGRDRCAGGPNISDPRKGVVFTAHPFLENARFEEAVVAMDDQNPRVGKVLVIFVTDRGVAQPFIEGLRPLVQLLRQNGYPDLQDFFILVDPL